MPTATLTTAPTPWPVTAGSCDYVRREDLEEARHWARFAVAAYGSPAWTWTSDKQVLPLLPWFSFYILLPCALTYL